MPKIGKYNLQEQIKQQESDNWWEHDFNIYDYIFENDDSLILPNDPSKYKSKEQMIGSFMHYYIACKMLNREINFYNFYVPHEVTVAGNSVLEYLNYLNKIRYDDLHKEVIGVESKIRHPDLKNKFLYFDSVISFNDDGYSFVDIIDYKYVGEKNPAYDEIKLNKILPQCILYESAYKKLYDQNCPDHYHQQHYMLNKIYIIFVNNVGDLFYATYNPMTKKFDENLEPKFGKVYRQVNKLSKQYFKNVA